jgi:hypothetical protein
MGKPPDLVLSVVVPFGQDGKSSGLRILG